MPDWVQGLVGQFPVLAVVLLIVWYAVRYIRKQHKEHLTRLQESIDKNLKSKDDAQKALLAAFKEERKQMADTIADLRKQRGKLMDQLNPPEEKT